MAIVFPHNSTPSRVGCMAVRFKEEREILMAKKTERAKKFERRSLGGDSTDG